MVTELEFWVFAGFFWYSLPGAWFFTTVKRRGWFAPPRYCYRANGMDYSGRWLAGAVVVLGPIIAPATLALSPEIRRDFLAPR